MIPIEDHARVALSIAREEIARADVPPPERRWPRSLFGILIVALVFYLFLLAQHRFGAYHDDGIYVTTAKSLAEGAGYRISSLPYEPAQTKYPPFYSLILSAVWKVYPAFPRNLTWMMLLSVIVTLCFLTVTWKYLVENEYATHWQALVVTALTALNWRTMILATSVYSEMLFALLAMGALHFAEKDKNASRYHLTDILAGVLIGLAFLTRSSGIALLISMALYYLIKRQWKRPLLPLTVATLFVVGWIAWCYVNQTKEQGINVPYYTSYLGHLTQVVGDLQSQSGSSKVSVFVNMAVQNFVGGIVISIPMVTTGLSYTAFAGLSSYVVAIAICVAFLCLVLIATNFGRALTTKIRLLHVYLISCLGLYLFWLPDVSYDRFLMPILPFLLLFLICELGILITLARKGLLSGETGKRIGGGLLLAMSVLVAGIIIYGYGSGIYSSFASLKTSANRAAEDAQAISWINENSDLSETIVCYRDPKFFLYTGHKAVRSFPMTEGFSWNDDQASRDRLAQALFSIIEEANARLVVVTSTDFELEDRPEQHRKTFDKLIEEHPEMFVLVFRSTEGQTRIYRTKTNTG